METPIWESIPTSIQTIIGVAAVMGAGWTWFVRPRVIALVSEAVVQINQERNKALAEMRDKLRGEIAGNRSGIAANRDSIFAVRDLVSAVRIETRDLLSGMQRESRQAHAAIGDRITRESTTLRTKIEEESTTLRTKIEELGTDTARLAGAVDVLTSIWREGDVRREIGTK